MKRRAFPFLSLIFVFSGCVANVDDSSEWQSSTDGEVVVGSSSEAASNFLTATQVGWYANAAGVPCGNRLRQAIAVAYAESGYKTSAYNYNTNGTSDKGLWQINSIHRSSCNLYNPTCNAREMARLSSKGANWRPWYGYGTSLYWSAYNGSARRAVESICSSPSELNPMVFDAPVYLRINRDLSSAFGSDVEAAKRHWLTYGVKEGRTASLGFDVSYYRRRYSDLRSAYGTSYSKYLMHWEKYGVKEGRRSSRTFDVKWYVNNHSDLKRVYGTNYQAAFEHWLRHGIAEGRRSASDFSIKAYLNRYADLKRAFGSDYRRAYLHWLRNGRREGRNPAP